MLATETEEVDADAQRPEASADPNAAATNADHEAGDAREEAEKWSEVHDGRSFLAALRLMLP
jgi:hypothetical protein